MRMQPEAADVPLRAEVADGELRIMGSKSELLRTLIAASSMETAAFGVHGSVLKMARHAGR